MTPTEQRIAIAEACGWRRRWNCYREKVLWVFSEFEQDEPGTEKAEFYDPSLSDLPDYLKDLNAMHEAEKTLGSTRNWMNYVQHLSFFFRKHKNAISIDSARNSGQIDLDYWATNLVHATAVQRSEAFLRTIGKWIERSPTFPV